MSQPPTGEAPPPPPEQSPGQGYILPPTAPYPIPPQPAPPHAVSPVVPQPPGQPVPPPLAQPVPPQPPGQPADSYPTSTPPYTGVVSAPPAGGPVPEMGMPGPSPYPAGPVSAPPPADPTVVGAAYLPTPPPKPRTVSVLAVVAALLLVASGVMTALYMVKSNELTRTKKELSAQISERDGTIEANTAEIEKLKQDLAAANEEIESVEQDLAGTEEARKELERQKGVIAECLTLLGEAGDAAAEGDKEAYEEIIEELEPVCDEAGSYL